LRQTPEAQIGWSVTRRTSHRQQIAEQEVDDFRTALGPFVVAAETTRMAMIFTNAKEPAHPIVFANDSFLALMGYNREEVLAQDFDFLLARGGDPDVQARIEASFGCDTDAPVEIECRRKDGQVFLSTIFTSPVRDDRGEVVQYFSSFVDLTAYHNHRLSLERVLSLQAELIHVSRVGAMGAMATTLAHELNQPLTAIANYASGCKLLLASQPSDIAAIADDLTHITESAVRAGAIINRLREMTRGGPTKRESFDLNLAVRESLELVRIGSCEGVCVESESKGVVMVEGDRVQIQQVIVNLARNGCEAAAALPDGHVTVTTKAAGDWAVVSVHDTGPGLSSAASAHLFEWANSSKPDGMGVGLSISRTIVEAHEGHIWLEGGAEGHTQFCFSVPRLAA
jgi:two-component system, LuxR family, sensor kinase FixL